MGIKSVDHNTPNRTEPVEQYSAKDIEKALARRRFDWWKDAFLAALTGLCSKSGAALATSNILLRAADIANQAGKYMMEAHEHFEVKGLIEPEAEEKTAR